MNEEERDHKIYIQRKVGYTLVYLSAKYDLPMHTIRKIIKREDAKAKMEEEKR